MPSVLLIGGVRSGKSAGAAKLVLSGASATDRVGVFVFGLPGVDAEFDGRIARHRSDRPESWETIEVQLGDDWVSRISDYDAVIVDCVGTMLSQFISAQHPQGTHPEEPSQEDVSEWALSQLERLLASSTRIAIVTNEVGLGLVSEHPMGRVFTDAMGYVNRWLAHRCDRSYFYVAGIPVELHEVEARPEWPALEESEGHLE